MTSVVMEMFSKEMMQEVSKNGTRKPPLPLIMRFFRPVMTMALSAGTLRQHKSTKMRRPKATPVKINQLPISTFLSFGKRL